MLGAKLRALRKKYGYTLVDVGRQTELSVSFLSDIERNRTNPSLETLKRLAACYQVTINELLEGVDTETREESNKYPPGFEEFCKEVEVEPEFIDLLMRVERRANSRAETKEQWKQYYYSLKTILGR